MQLTAAMVGMLGGPALMVLTVLQIEREPRSISFLIDMTNLSDKTVSGAVRKLKTLGMISETGRYIYQVVDKAVQLPLPALDHADEAEESSEEEPTENYPLASQGEAQDTEAAARKISDLALNESMNQESIDDSGIIDSFIDAGEPGNFEPSRPSGASPRESGAGGDETALAGEGELRALGFYGRGLRELASIPGLTLAEARWQVEHAPSLGAALSRLKRRQPVPDGRRERDGPEDRNRYIGGQFAEFIEH